MSYWTEKFSYWGGSFLSSNRVGFMLGRDELLAKKVPHTIVSSWDGSRWTEEGYGYPAVALCCASTPHDEVVLVGHGGEMRAGQLGHLQTIAPIDIDPPTGKAGYLTCARAINGRVYVGGMDRQAYRRVAHGWEALNEGLPQDATGLVTGFEAIDGFSEQEIYAVGHEGEIWCFDGVRWHSCPSPSNVILLGVHCADDGLVYACGQGGVIIRGRGNVWQTVEHDVDADDLWDIVRFKGVVYTATRNVLFCLNADQLTAVDFGEVATPFSFYRLLASSQQMVTVGDKDVMAFDGMTWVRVDG